MQLGMIGLGRMGANMVRRLEQAGHECVGYDVDPAAVDALAGETGMAGADSLEDVRQARSRPPRHVWIMVPAAFVDSTIASLVPLLERGDTIIDGGNSWYHDDIDRAGPLDSDHGIDYVDVGTSGGTHGLERGYCLMVGGPDRRRRAADADLRLARPRRRGRRADAGRGPRDGEPTDAPSAGWLHCGPNGAGHFVKMVHNGIEYGLMAAYAEGLNVLAKADIGAEDHAVDAETAPLAHPRVLPLRPRPGGDHRGVAAGLGRSPAGCST